MPFVRFSRDKRGYEYVYLMDVPSRQARGAHPRVLYWFRTPPGLKVGREPFDKAAQQALEARYPELTFDWKQIKDTPKPAPDAGAPWRERRRLERAAKRARAAEEVHEIEEAAGPDEDAGGEDASPEHEDEILEAMPGGAEQAADPSSPEEREADSAWTAPAESGTTAVTAGAPGDRTQTAEAPQGGDPSGRPRRRRRRRGGRGRRRSDVQPLDAASAGSAPADAVAQPGSESGQGEAEPDGPDSDDADNGDDGTGDGNPENDG